MSNDEFFGHPDDLMDYVEDHPYAKARYNGKPGQLGILSTLDTNGSARKRVRIRYNNRRRHQYQTISEHGMRYLEIKVGSRYRPASEVLA